MPYSQTFILTRFLEAISNAVQTMFQSKSPTNAPKTFPIGDITALSSGNHLPSSATASFSDKREPKIPTPTSLRSPCSVAIYNTAASTQRRTNYLSTFGSSQSSVSVLFFYSESGHGLHNDAYSSLDTTARTSLAATIFTYPAMPSVWTLVVIISPILWAPTSPGSHWLWKIAASHDCQHRLTKKRPK